ncbi:ABC transporter permease [Halobacterium sp. DL1]|jgi:multiple sugar transport system permease protein|nr:ABC transporter permease [Halobacterium sp. DL1]
MNFGNRNSQRSFTDQALTFLTYGLGIGIAVLCVLPFLYMLSVVFRPSDQLWTVQLIPSSLTLTTLETSFGRVGDLLWNSVLISSGTMLVSLIIVIPSAYVFGRLDFKGKSTMFYLVLLIIMFPFVLLIIPIAESWFTLGLYNTVPGMWIAYQIFVAPFAIWVLRDYFAKLPLNLEESARIYGCTQFSAFRRVILPLAMPAIIAVAFLSFLVAWNDFLMGSMLTDGTGPRPAVVGLYLTIHGTSASVPWGLIMGETLIIGTPPTVLYLLARKSLSESFEVSE